MLDVAMVRVRQYFGFILAYSIHSWVLPHDLEVQCIRLVLLVKHKQCSQEVMGQSQLLLPDCIASTIHPKYYSRQFYHQLILHSML